MSLPLILVLCAGCIGPFYDACCCNDPCGNSCCGYCDKPYHCCGDCYGNPCASWRPILGMPCGICGACAGCGHSGVCGQIEVPPPPRFFPVPTQPVFAEGSAATKVW